MAGLSCPMSPIVPDLQRRSCLSKSSISGFFISSHTFSVKSFSIVVAANKYKGISEKDIRILDKYGIDPEKIVHENKSDKSPQKVEDTKDKAKIGKTKARRQTHRLLSVLGGKIKGKKLFSPTDMGVRPMMEVVKGATFHILQSICGCPAMLRSGRWLDLYCGTGSVGIEAMSRGCSEAHFVEIDSWVISHVLSQNLVITSFLSSSVIHPVRVENFLKRASEFVSGTFDYISVTPPYTEVTYPVLMNQIGQSSVVGNNTFVVVEYPLAVTLLDSCGHLKKITNRRFGRTILAIYGPSWAVKKDRSK